MAKKYAYAVVPSQGCYGSGEDVYAVYRTDDADNAVRKAKSLTATHQRDMACHGGTSGGYRAVLWGTEGTYAGLGHYVDRMSTIR